MVLGKIGYFENGICKTMEFKRGIVIESISFEIISSLRHQTNLWNFHVCNYLSDHQIII